jgi:hypothetical protein
MQKVARPSNDGMMATTETDPHQSLRDSFSDREAQERICCQSFQVDSAQTQEKVILAC